jgi:hypothetical protein
MKKSDDKFEWTEEADVAFAQLKKVLSTPPGLVAPNEKEPLLLYIAATHQVVSTVLVVERSKEGKAHGVQRPVYFVSEVLSPTKQRYPLIRLKRIYNFLCSMLVFTPFACFYTICLVFCYTSHFVTLFSAHGDVVVGFAIFHIVYSKKKKRQKEKTKRHSSMVCECWWAPDGIG